MGVTVQATATCADCKTKVEHAVSVNKLKDWVPDGWGRVRGRFCGVTCFVLFCGDCKKKWDDGSNFDQLFSGDTP